MCFLYVCARPMCMHAQDPCVCMRTTHVYACARPMCMHAQDPCVCMRKTHVYVCARPMCMYVQDPCVCMCKTPGGAREAVCMKCRIGLYRYVYIHVCTYIHGYLLAIVLSQFRQRTIHAFPCFLALCVCMLSVLCEWF